MVRRPIEPRAYRDTLARYPTGVTIVTALGDDGWPIGMTIGTFTSVSLEPPLVGFLPAKSSGAWSQIAATGSFCVNVLRHDQHDLCGRFGGRHLERFEGVDWRAAPATGSPLLPGVLAWVDCSIHDVADAGDHWFVMGRVLDFDSDSGLPMVFFGGALDTVRSTAA